MPKKKEPPLSAEEQRRRFEATAKQLGVSGESAPTFKRVLSSILQKRPKRPSMKK